MSNFLPIFTPEQRYTEEGLYISGCHEALAKETLFRIAKEEGVGLRVALIRAVKRSDGSPLAGHFGNYDPEELLMVWVDCLTDACLTAIL